MSNSKLAAGSSRAGGLRMEAACVRIIDACLTLERKVDRVMAELDNLTMPGVVRMAVDDEDSLVIALHDLSDDLAEHPKP